MGDVGSDVDVSTVGKKDNSEREASASSTGSSPGAELETYPKEAPPQKRKGGRKPIYATSEERKQRNRQAQAAFRERRTEYIKQLETTIKHHEDRLQTLQQSHQTAADECLMLRYKNSLLERVLLENGIDVQAELRAKNGSPNLGSLRPPPAAPPPLPLQRAIASKGHQARRSYPPVTSKGLKADVPLVQPNAKAKGEGVFSARSPKLQTTSPSNPSPTASSIHSPGLVAQGGAISPTAGPLAQHQQHQLQPQQPVRRQSQGVNRPPQTQHRPSIVDHPSSSGVSTTSTIAGPEGTVPADTAAGHYAYYRSSVSNSVNHIDSVSTDPEYDAPADMEDDETMHHPAPAYTLYAQPYQQLPTQGMPPPAHFNSSVGQAGAAHQGYDSYDPALDADHFGLSASMSFPTHFSFGTSHLR